jgi:site-specific DNA-adenine methylase
MYWLLDYDEQERVRQQIIELQKTILRNHKREQDEQIFPFIGRKSRLIARNIIEKLNPSKGLVCDPFLGSGTFLYAALDDDCEAKVNEWEPYAYEMSTAPLRGTPSDSEIADSFKRLSDYVLPIMTEIYKTKCPECGSEIMFDAIFFDRKPEEYYHPMKQERMGENGETVIFREGYKCSCGCCEKFYDDFDEKIRLNLETLSCNFPNADLIENSRLNFTAPIFTKYKSLFSRRQQIALAALRDGIATLPDSTRGFFEDTFISIIHLGKYTDYRSKSQDNHCPENRLKETNLYHRYCERLQERISYIRQQRFQGKKFEVSCSDFRSFLSRIADGSVSLMLTDPPYGDNAQYFEHAQRVHPFMGYSLREDAERLSKEVVISNAPSRTDKHDKSQFLADIETLISEAHRVIKPHGYLVLYFRPEQKDWISDLNKLKHFGRKHGLEPLITIPVDNQDPSLRVLASAAWTFKNDVCFVFLRLNDSERRWYEGDIDVDELVYLAASAAATDQGLPFVIDKFNHEFQAQLRRSGLLRLADPKYSGRIFKTLERYTMKNQAQYILTGLSPYSLMNKDMDAEMRLREFAPAVIEELTANGAGFTFEDYVIHLASYMENGSRKIIEDLHSANKLLPELLLTYAYEDKKENKFFARAAIDPLVDNKGRQHLRSMDPGDFEILIGDYFKKRGFTNVKVIGRSCDRGVDVLATDIEGQLELIQCKRWREGNNVGSTPIQRVDSYMRSRHAVKAWVVTTSDFTSEGRDEARITNVTIMNGKDLIRSLEVYYPGKYVL